MSETLWAAIIGGTIAIAATIPPLIYSHYHWKKEKKLEHLKAERRHMEELYSIVLNNFDVLIKRDEQAYDIRTRIGLTLPHEIGNEIFFILDNNEVCNEDVIQKVIIRGKIASLLRNSLDEIDKKIEETMS